jgi:hypothetical protein
MHAVITRLPVKDTADWAELARKCDEFFSSVTSRHPAVRQAALVRAEQNEAIVFILFESRAALDAISRDVAGPWFAEHIRPYLAGPVVRTLGEVVAGATGGG